MTPKKISETTYVTLRLMNRKTGAEKLIESTADDGPLYTKSEAVGYGKGTIGRPDSGFDAFAVEERTIITYVNLDQ